MEIQVESVETQTPGVTTYKVTVTTPEPMQPMADEIPLSELGQQILERLQKKSG